MASTIRDITATPAAGQRINHEGKEYQTIKEGLAHILIPAAASADPKTTPRGDNQAQSVFYNPIQQFNRDLSVLVIKTYGEGIIERKLKTTRDRRDKNRQKKRKRQAEIGERPQKSEKLEDGASAPAIEDSANVGQLISEAQGELQHTSKNQEESIGAHTIDPSPAVEKQADGEEEQDGAIQSTAMEGVETTIGKAEMTLAPEEKPADRSSNTPQPSFTILDALSATGLRALRYAHEIPFATSITANDLLPTAVQTIYMNVKHNNLEDKIQTTTGNAMSHMYGRIGEDEKEKPTWAKKYDVIDLDPYGTAAPFIDAAVQAVRDDGGLLCVTYTDAGVWASNSYPEKAYSLYGGVTVKGAHSHEGGLRLLLHSIATAAARYGLAMEPLLSLSIDFYARIFVRVFRSPADVKFLAGKTMMVYNCDSGCGAWSTQMLGRNKLAQNGSKAHYWKHVYALGPSVSGFCAHCGTKTHVGGPMYAGPLHSLSFVQKLIDTLPSLDHSNYATIPRLEGMLNLALDEHLPPLGDETSSSLSPTATAKTGKPHDPATIDHYPFFFKPDMLAKVVHCITPHENALRGALRGLGYRVTRSHAKPGTIKTDADWGVVWSVMKEWVKQKAPVKEGKIKKGTAGWRILYGMEDEKKKEEKESGSGDIKAEVLDPGKNGEVEEGKKSGEGKEEYNTTTGKELKIVFDEQLGKETDKKKLVRYQINPRENWGPMQKAKGPS